ncbi:MAG: hypothetical protein PHH09_05060 [Methanoregulaceae archaeon]|nr:hypothetical protein [Methanoregulaceae archaeon]
MKDKINVPPYVNTAKGQTTDYVIRAGMLCEIERGPGDVTILPDVDELITEKEWAALVEKHGSEEAVLKVLDCDDARPAKKAEDVLEAR